LEAVKEYAPTAKVFLAQSGVQFKNSGKPISEFDEFEASSPYAVARIQSVFAARYYRSLGIKVYNGYLFHHESPRRPDCHVSQIVVRGVQKILHGSSDVIELGNISVEKEWTFAGDIVEGILTLVEQDNVFEAAIGSGKAYSIKNWVEQCFGLIGKDWTAFVVTKSSFVPEYQRLVSNPQTIFALGWKPVVTLAQLAEMMVNQSCINKEPYNEVQKYSTGSVGCER
jgi:GDPmannose 4,6-dehydratase